MLFYPGLHQPSDAKHFERACIAEQRMRPRRKPIGSCKIIVDSGAFMKLALHGGYPDAPDAYCRELYRIATAIAYVEVAVAQDYMCEPFMLKKTGLTTEDHQRLTIDRYDALLRCGPPVLVMPVVQGFEPHEYARHIHQYGDRLRDGQWVGIGSVCKRQSNPKTILTVIDACHAARPGLKFHGFGVKTTALKVREIRDGLYSADSMAWSYSARKQGRKANDWREAKAFEHKICSAS